MINDASADPDSRPEVPPVYPKESRNYTGWFSISATLSFLLLLAMLGYFSPQREGAVLKSHAETTLKSEVELGVAAKIADNADLSSVEVKLRALAHKDPEAAVIDAVILTEQKKSVDSVDLDSINRSKKPADSVVFQIYSNSSLSPQKATALAASLPKGRFVYELAAVHALEKAGVRDARSRLTGGTGRSRLVVAGLLLILGLGAGTMLLFGYAIARAAGVLEPLGFALGYLSIPDADRVAIRCGQFFLAYVSIQLVASFGARWLPKSIAEIVIYALIIGAFVFISRKPVGNKKLGFRELGLRSEKLGNHILWGLAAAVANVPIVLVVSLISMAIFKGLPVPEHPVTFELQDTTSKLMIFKIAFSACVAAPIIEELLFRGTFFPALAVVLRSPVLAGIVTSLAFGLIHPTGIPAVLPLACIGGMSCFLAYQTRSLVPSMVMHAFHNGVTLLVSLLILR